MRGPDLFEWLTTQQGNSSSGLVSGSWICEPQAANISKQVASGLAYIHGRTPYLVHRDVKPENLRWSANPSAHPDADLKLLDFGLVYIGGSIDELQGRRIGTAA